MQTVLGAGGAIGKLLAKELTNYTKTIRLVSRHPEKINADDQLISADLLNPKQVSEVVAGSEIVYLMVGLPYKTKVWEIQWPVIMQNVIDACLKHQAKLVFFDNIYLYKGADLSNITETNAVAPPSRKGHVRAQIVRMLWEAVENRGLTALIARSADFYGPDIKGTSLLTETVITPLQQGKTANWMVSDRFRHSFTYTPDAAKATALLGNTPDAYGQTWHLPTAQDPPTGKEWIELIASELNVKPKYRVVSRPMLRILGLFVPVLRESYEMLYQFDKDYVFNSDKFENRFAMPPTPYNIALKHIIKM